MADKPLDACEVNILAHYNTKNPHQIKTSVKYFREVLGNITDRGQLRNFINSYAKEKGLEISSRLLSELDTLGKHAINMDRVMNKLWNGDHLQAALSMYEETSSAVKGSGVNAERSIQVHQKAFWGAFDREISGIGFSKEFSNGIYDSEIRQVIRSGEAYTGANAVKVNQAAGIIKKYYSIMNHELNSAGMRTAYRPDYDGPIRHDGTVIYGKFTEWSTSLEKALDFDKEFPEVPKEEIAAFKEMARSGNLKANYDRAMEYSREKAQYNKEMNDYTKSVNAAKKNPKLAVLEKPIEPEKGFQDNQVQRILMYSYDNITRTESALVDEIPRSLEKPTSIAERRSYAKSFTTWRSGEAMQTYLNEFGKYKTLNDQMQYYARSAARDVGLTSVFGGSPFKGHQMNKELVTRLMRLERKSSIEIENAMKTLDTAWGNLTKPKIPEPHLAGQISMNVRAMAAQAKLGMAGFTSIIMDPIATTLQHRNLMQEGIIKALWDSYSGYIPSMATAMRGDIEDSHLFSQYDLATTLEELYRMGGGVSSANSRMGSALQFSGELVSKGSGAYYFNKVSHINNAKMYMKFLSDASKGKEINPVMEADLAKFNITAEDLKIIEKLDLGNEGGMRNLFNLGPDDLMAVDHSYTTQLEAGNALSSLKERMNLWLLEKIKTGSPQAGNRERRLLLGDTTAGTMEGEVRRILTQFKATQTKVFIDTTYGASRRLNPEGPQAGQGSKMDWTNKQNAYNLGAMAFFLTTAGAANMLLNSMISGDEKQLKRWREGDLTLLPEAFSRGGAAYVLGDLMSFKSNNAENVTQLIGSPALNAIVTPVTAVGQAVGGNPEKGALSVAKAFVPGANMWFLKPFVQGMSDAASKSKSSRSGGRDPLK